MTAEQYIAVLEKELRYLPKEERDEALNYYKEYFYEAREASANGTYDPTQEFGEPAKLAAQIKQESARKIVEPDEGKAQDRKEKKTSFSEVWIVILAILASPIAFPVGIILVVLIFTLTITVVATSFALFASGIAIGAVGLALIFASVFLFITHGITGLVAIGFGFIYIGIAILLCLFGAWVEKSVVLLIAKAFGKLVRKKEVAE